MTLKTCTRKTERHSAYILYTERHAPYLLNTEQHLAERHSAYLYKEENKIQKNSLLLSVMAPQN
jgi:hypothetical protein